MSEIEKLQKYYEENNIVRMGVTTAYELGLSDKKPTSEEVAAELNRMHEWLANPVNNLTSRIKGHIFLKKDTISCMENRTDCFVPVPLTEDEKWEVRRLKEDVELFQKAIDMIKELSSK